MIRVRCQVEIVSARLDGLICLTIVDIVCLGPVHFNLGYELVKKIGDDC